MVGSESPLDGTFDASRKITWGHQEKGCLSSLPEEVWDIIAFDFILFILFPGEIKFACSSRWEKD